MLSLLDEHHLLSLSDLERLIPEADHSTLFRNVKNLVETGDVKQITVAKNKVMYERSSHEHDHLVCTDCGAVEAIHLPRPKHTTFKVQDIVAHGACTGCNNKTS